MSAVVYIFKNQLWRGTLRGFFLVIMVLHCRFIFLCDGKFFVFNFRSNQMSLEERLNVMDIDSNMKVNGGGEAFLKNGQMPQTDNLLVLLVQGLQSNDAKILNVRILNLLN
jgi:hypothetical protein